MVRLPPEDASHVFKVKTYDFSTNLQNQRWLLQKKAANDLKFKVISRNKPKNMAVHVETISLQHDSVRRALKITPHQLDKDLHSIGLRLVPMLSCKTDENMEARLKQVAIKR